MVFMMITLEVVISLEMVLNMIRHEVKKLLKLDNVVKDA